VTFGSFNHLAKINDRVLALWAEILERIEGSRLLLLSKASRETHTVQFFEQRGIASDRIGFLGYYPASSARSGKVGPTAWLERYRHIDIALDPFPYNGMTTTCDALW